MLPFFLTIFFFVVYRVILVLSMVKFNQRLKNLKNVPKKKLVL